MFIFLFIGESGSGKSTIVNEIVKNQPYIFNVIKSYTTRKQRDENDNDHTFIKNIKELENETIVASTEIEGEFYGATEKQFSKDKLNLYIVDKKGIEDIKKFFNNEKIIVIQILRDNIEIDKERADRNIITNYENCDYIINNKNLNDTVNELHKVIFNEIRY